MEGQYGIYFKRDRGTSQAKPSRVQPDITEAVVGVVLI